MKYMKAIFASRKNRLFLGTVAAMLAAEYGLDLPQEIIYGTIALAASVIVGHAVEDHGRHVAANGHGLNRRE